MQPPEKRQEADKGKTGGCPGDNGDSPKLPKEAADKNANHPSDTGSGIETGHHRCPSFGHQLGTEGKAGDYGELKGKERHKTFLPLPAVMFGQETAGANRHKLPDRALR